MIVRVEHRIDLELLVGSWAAGDMGDAVLPTSRAAVMRKLRRELTSGGGDRVEYGLDDWGGLGAGDPAPLEARILELFPEFNPQQQRRA